MAERMDGSKYLKSHLLRERAERGKRTSEASIPLMPNRALRRHLDHTSRGHRPRWPKKCYSFLTNYRCMTLTYQTVNTHPALLAKMPHGSLISSLNWKRHEEGSLALTWWFTTWWFTTHTMSSLSRDNELCPRTHMHASKNNPFNSNACFTR